MGQKLQKTNGLIWKCVLPLLLSFYQKSPHINKQLQIQNTHKKLKIIFTFMSHHNTFSTKKQNALSKKHYQTRTRFSFLQIQPLTKSKTTGKFPWAKKVFFFWWTRNPQQKAHHFKQQTYTGWWQNPLPKRKALKGRGYNIRASNITIKVYLTNGLNLVALSIRTQIVPNITKTIPSMTIC
jgi:hypothetical protein